MDQLPPSPADRARLLHLRRHFALMVVSEEALELAHRDTVDGVVPEIDFSALDRALAEAKAADAELRALANPQAAAVEIAACLGAIRAAWESDVAVLEAVHSRAAEQRDGAVDVAPIHPGGVAAGDLQQGEGVGAGEDAAATEGVDGHGPDDAARQLVLGAVRQVEEGNDLGHGVPAADGGASVTPAGESGGTNSKPPFNPWTAFAGGA